EVKSPGLPDCGFALPATGVTAPMADVFGTRVAPPSEPRGSGLRRLFSRTRVQLVLYTAFTRMSQLTGLNAVSPLKRSNANDVSLENITCSPRPKNSALPGVAVLTPLGTGSLRASKSEKFFAVRLRKMSCPMIGTSPLSLLCRYGSQSLGVSYAYGVSVEGSR